MRSAVLVALVLMLAGCTAERDGGTTEDSVSTTPTLAPMPDPTPTRQSRPAEEPRVNETLALPNSRLSFTAGDCDGRYDYLAVDLDWAAAQLPEGYAPKPFNPGARGALVFVTVRCPALQQGNATLAADQVTMVSIWTGGSFPSESHYVLRAYHQDGASPLAQAMAAEGIEIVAANVEMTDWSGPMTINAEGHSVATQSLGPLMAGPTEIGFRYSLERPDRASLQWGWSIRGPTEATGFGQALASTEGSPYLGACPAGLAATQLPSGVCQCETMGLLGFRLNASME